MQDTEEKEETELVAAGVRGWEQCVLVVLTDILLISPTMFRQWVFRLSRTWTWPWHTLSVQSRSKE